MKLRIVFAVWLAGLGCSFASELIRVDAQIIDGPAALLLEKTDFETKANLFYPDLNVLKAPRMLLLDGKSSTISIQETKPVRSADDNSEIQIPAGVRLKILSRIAGENIDFTANVIVRNLVKDDKPVASDDAEFSTFEFYFSGTCKDGGSVFVRSKGVQNNRRVSLFLVFTRQKEK
jgi:hypothetical protein